jgi:hypothetical protein
MDNNPLDFETDLGVVILSKIQPGFLNSVQQNPEIILSNILLQL